MSQTVPAPDPLVLLCGLNTTPSVWDGVRRELAGTAAITTPALPCDNDVDAIARGLLEALPPQFHLCGYSFGGYVAMALVALCPERIRSLLLVGTTPDADTEQQRLYRSSLIDRLRLGEHDAIVREQTAWMLHPVNAARPEVVEFWLDQARRYGPDALIAHLKACMTRPDRRALLLQSKVPIGFIAGAGDRLFPAKRQRDLADAVGANLCVTIPDAAHGLPFEQPAALARVIAEWIRQIP